MLKNQSYERLQLEQAQPLAHHINVVQVFLEPAMGLTLAAIRAPLAPPAHTRLLRDHMGSLEERLTGDRYQTIRALVVLIVKFYGVNWLSYVRMQLEQAQPLVHQTNGTMAFLPLGYLLSSSPLLLLLTPNVCRYHS